MHQKGFDAGGRTFQMGLQTVYPFGVRQFLFSKKIVIIWCLCQQKFGVLFREQKLQNVTEPEAGNYSTSQISKWWSSKGKFPLCLHDRKLICLVQVNYSIRELLSFRLMKLVTQLLSCHVQVCETAQVRLNRHACTLKIHCFALTSGSIWLCSVSHTTNMGCSKWSYLPAVTSGLRNRLCELGL